MSVISAAFIALGRSCLLANTSRTASLNSSCNVRSNQFYNSITSSKRIELLFEGIVTFEVESSYLIQHPVQLIPRFNHTVTIVTVNHKDESLCVLEVVSPQGTDLIPNFISWLLVRKNKVINKPKCYFYVNLVDAPSFLSLVSNTTDRHNH